MKLFAYYSVYNEADFIEYSLRSIYNHVDKIIIIEGAWKETYLVNGHKRSNDGTINLLRKFPDPKNKIELHCHNEDSQLKQRSKVFNYLPNEDLLLWLIDGDEVYEEEQASRVAFEAKKSTTIESRPLVYTFESLIFINDFFNYSPVRYPRLFRIQPQCEYKFIQPNHIARNGFPLNDKTQDTDIRFFHYSYCHSPARFQEKKKERTKLHGQFAWELREDLVQRDDANIQSFEGEHPEIMKSHPLFGVKKHRKVTKPEVIVYVEHSGIGNLVMSTPMLRALRIAKPNAHIFVYAWSRSSGIIEGLDCVDFIYNVGNHPGLPSQIDHLLISPVGAIQSFVQTLSKRAKHIYNLPAINPWTQHESERKMLLAKRVGYRGPTPPHEIPYFDYNKEFVTGFLGIKGQYICINASYLRSEHWHLKHFGDIKYAQLLDKLYKEFPEYKYVFVGDFIDQGDADRIISWAKDIPLEKCINACGFSFDIKQTAALLAQSRILIGNDGALQHIAEAVGTPTVTIFTFTNPVKNRPIGGKVVMVPCQDRLACQHGNWSKCESRGCLDVPVDKVLTTVKEVLNGKQILLCGRSNKNASSH